MTTVSLENISKKFETDKGEIYHNYLHIYEKYFDRYRNSLQSFLEIGVWKGDSIKMWRDYFNSGILIGIDIIDPLPDVSECDDTYLYHCDQGSRDSLNELFTPGTGFDIIIDDGGHMMHQQQITLAVMFKYVQSGGIFVIEDLHTSGNPAYELDPNSTKTLSMLQNYLNSGVIESSFMTPDEMKYLNENIKSIVIEQGNVSPIAFITKK